MIFTASANPQSIKKLKKLIFAIIFIFAFDVIFFPAPIIAADMETMSPDELEIFVQAASKEQLRDAFKNNFPHNEDVKVLKTSFHTITAYNSEAAQCDDTPCITANGFDLCEHGVEDSIAANFLKFGTRIRMPELFGDRIFVVRDRMHERYHNRIDVWMLDKQDAKNFGVKVTKIEILAN
jgi:3D (Asp-Asp-Asp) domain-containing protein